MWTPEKQTHSMITAMLISVELAITEKHYTGEDFVVLLKHCGNVAEWIMKDTETRFTE